MSLINGQVVVITDYTMAVNALQNGCKVIYFGDPTGSTDPMMNNFIMGSVLLPKLEFMQDIINGSQERFVNNYTNQILTDPNIFEFIKTIILALYQGVSVIIYIPEDSLGFGFHQILFNTIYNIWGIHPQMGPQDQFFVDPSYMPKIAELLYNCGFLSFEQYIGVLPMNIFEDPKMLEQLLTNIFGPQQAKNVKFVKYVKDLKNQMVSVNKVLKPIMYIN